MTQVTQKAYDKQTAEFIAAVIRNMPDFRGNVMQYCIANPGRLQRILKKAIIDDAVMTHGIWTRIEAGSDFSWPADAKRDLTQQLNMHGVRLKNPIGDLLRQLGQPFSRNISLVRVPLSEVVGKGGGDVSLLARIVGFGHGVTLCPIDTAISYYLRHRHTGRGERESLLFAGGPLCCDGKRYFLSVVKTGMGDLFLSPQDADSCSSHCMNDHVVFAAD